MLTPWLIESTVAYLDVRRLTSGRIQLAKEVQGTRQPSEYQLQSEFSAKAASLYNRLPREVAMQYRVMSEAFGPGRGNRARLDLLITNGKMLRLGQELLISGSQRDFDEHCVRANKYAGEHDCVVWCLNFSLSGFDTRRVLTLPPPTTMVRLAISESEGQHKCAAHLQDNRNQYFDLLVIILEPGALQVRCADIHCNVSSGKAQVHYDTGEIKKVDMLRTVGSEMKWIFEPRTRTIG